MFLFTEVCGDSTSTCKQCYFADAISAKFLLGSHLIVFVNDGKQHSTAGKLPSSWISMIRHKRSPLFVNFLSSELGSIGQAASAGFGEDVTRSSVCDASACLVSC